MAFSRLCGVTQYSYYMVDIIENTDVSALVPAQWASAGVTIFEMVGKLALYHTRQHCAHGARPYVKSHWNYIF